MADEDMTEETSIRLAKRSRRLLGDLLRPTPARSSGWCCRADRERRPALGPLPRQGGHRQGHPADPRGRRPRAAAEIVAVLVAAIVQAITRTFPGALGTIGQKVFFHCGCGCSGTSSGSAGLPRQLHVGAGHLAADLRRRRDQRDAGERLRRSDHRGADTGRHGSPVALARREARPGRPGLLPVAGLADTGSASRRPRLPAHPRDGGAGDRALRRDDERHPRGAGVPPRAAQPGDLRRRQRGLPRREPVAFRLVGCSCRASG